MPYPTGLDLTAFLQGRGLAADEDACALVMAGVCAQWEKDTQWYPFLYGGSTSQRTYNGNGDADLFLNAGICSTSGLVVTVGGDTMTLGTHFFMRPSDAPAKVQPYTRLEFTFNLGMSMDDVLITAAWGYCSALPADVSRALLCKGAAEWMRDYTNDAVGLNGPAGRIKQGPVEIESGGANSGQGAYDGSIQKQLGGAYDRTVMRYLPSWSVTP